MNDEDERLIEALNRQADMDGRMIPVMKAVTFMTVLLMIICALFYF